jgi:peptide/nickel transport system substrate-binding protein
LERDAVAAIDADSGLIRRSLHSTAYSLIYLNWRLPAFRDDFFRRALQLSLNRDAMIEELLAGQAVSLDSPIVPGLWAHSGTPDAYAYDVERANSLLDAINWQRRGSFREVNGAPIRFELAASDDPTQVALAEEIARQWRELGLDVEVVVSGGSQFVEGVLLPRTFHAALVTIDPGPDPDQYAFWHSTQILGDGRNLASYSNPAADELLERARQETAASVRAADYREFQEIFAQEFPAVLLYTSTYQYVVAAEVNGLSPGLLVQTSARFRDVQQWYVETARADGG